MSEPQPYERPKWGDEISDERKAELQQYLQTWEQETDHGERRGPFDGIKLTGEDVFWLAELSGREYYLVSSAVPNLHLDGADLSYATLTNANLRRATLTGANLRFATLDDADLGEATLDDADLGEAMLDGADLSGATLTGADLSDATLTDANLFLATLTGANLTRAMLTGADLTGSRMDASTRLEEAELDQHTQLADVVWNNVPLTRVDWSKVPHTGDEDAIKKAMTRADRIDALREAARAYHGLSSALRAQGLAEASGYRLQEQRLLRRQQRLERHYGAWVLSGLLDLVAGYGEAPGRIFVAYFVVILSFAAAYFGITNFGGTVLVSHSTALTWYEGIVLSLSSFHGRGFFPQTINLGDPVAIVAALEAVCGLFIELILIATFSKRFLAS